MNRTMETFTEIKIKDHQDCPCGSKLQFNKCCKNKGYVYGALEKNYKNEQIIYNATSQEIRANRINELMMKAFDENSEAPLSISKGIDILMELYGICDEAYADVERFYTCKEGCSFCCELNVSCTALEAENIRRFITKNLRHKVEEFSSYIANNKHKITSFKTLVLLSTNEIDVVTGEYHKSRTKCPFLSSENRCMVYNVRPINCRKHMVSSDISECLPSADNAFVRNLMESIKGQYAIAVLNYAITRYANLKFSNPKSDGPATPINKTFYEWFDSGFDSINLENI